MRRDKWILQPIVSRFLSLSLPVILSGLLLRTKESH